ncbi:hypothetical protein EGW08_000172 [Elysia chlorotica]|uniref:Uncharacterized protein n=1 Tax=Elysia chlorotica TaxID=188477 RepID=A0A3S1AH47_ELYCH|nr:hypothetical protein EGW08_000172 [Elysia chlorotica]
MAILSASMKATTQSFITQTIPTAPGTEKNLITTAETTYNPVIFMGNDHLKELGWLIPLVIGIIIVMVLLALLCFYGVTALERKLTIFCFNTFGCCRPGPSTIGEESESLSRTFAMKVTHGYESTSALN